MFNRKRKNFNSQARFRGFYDSKQVDCWGSGANLEPDDICKENLVSDSENSVSTGCGVWNVESFLHHTREPPLDHRDTVSVTIAKTLPDRFFLCLGYCST